MGISGDSIVVIMVAALFALLPDIDTVKSRIGRRLEPFSTLLSAVFRHRGFLHSFIFVGFVYFGMLYLFSAAIAAAAVIGYSSHLLLDALTKEGIMPLSPFSRRRVKGFVRTGSLLEQVILAAMAFLLVLKLV